MRYILLSLLTSVLFNIADVSAQKIKVDLDLVKATAEKWSEAHNTKDRRAFKQLYAPSVLFYTKELPRRECIEIKFKRLSSGKSFSQKIVTDLESTVYESGIIKCDFTKEVTSGSKVTQYKSYLLLKQKDNSYEIVGESDLATDAKLDYKLKLGVKHKISELEIIDFSKTVKNDFIISQSDSDEAISFFQWTAAGSVFLIVLIISYQTFIKREKDKKTTTAHSSQILTLEPKFVNEAVRKQRVHFSPEQKSDNSTDVNKKKGDDFEGYVTDQFDDKFFKLLHWNADVYHKGKSPEANKHPDLIYEFKYKGFEKKFAVECKFKSNLVNYRFEIESRKLNNYREYSRKNQTDVYIVLGLYGKPTAPNELYLIPLSVFNDSNFVLSHQLKNFRRSTGKFFYDRTLDRLV